MSNIHNIISFYRDCFIEENKGGGISNFLSSSVELHSLIKKREEHISGLLPYTPIADDRAQQLQAEISLYEKEKEFIYASIFLLGYYTAINGKRKKLIAPLIIYPAEIVYENELYFCQADLSNPSFNPIILELIKRENPDFNEDDFFEALPYGAITAEESGKLSRILDKQLKTLDSSLMVDYPNNVSSYKINTLFKKNKLDDSYLLAPCSGIGLIKKSTKTRNVISELNHIAQSGTPNAPILQKLFNNKHNIKPSKDTHFITPVTVLSEAQENVLKSAFEHPLSMVVGPPGTGKSYTISNLVISLMNQGMSVLVCSRNDGAVDVIQHLIKQILGNDGMCVRVGKREQVKELKDRIQFLISRGNITLSRKRQNNNDNLFFLQKRDKKVSEIKNSLNQYIKTFEQADIDELVSSESIQKHDTSNSIWNRIVRYYLKKKISSSKEIPLWEVTDLYLDLVKDLAIINKERINYTYDYKLRNTVVKNRTLLKNYLSSLRATNTGRQKQFLESIDLKELLAVFPVWLTNMKDVGAALPLKKELFDVIIIDEASQCDIATSLPLLHRAKKAVIVGDPKQLKHLSFLSKSKQQLLIQKNQLSNENPQLLNYRSKSILDLTEGAIQHSSQVNFLDEHYRSEPDIIDFSNKQFYYRALKVMTSTKKDSPQSLFHVPVKGNRNSKGVNQQEIDAILAKVKQLIEEEKNIVSQQKTSIGILSPFRKQVDEIIEVVKSELSFQEIDQHRILIGTAHSFQGEERGVMFLSFVLDNHTNHAAYRFINKDDVFNVSITRAKNTQYVYTSFTSSQLKGDSLLRKYIDSIQFGVTEEQSLHNTIKDNFSDEVCQFIHQLQFKTHSPYTIAGISIDIAIEKDGKFVAIDLVGYPGPYEKTIALYKYKALLRAGIKMIPIPYSLWRFKRVACENRINELLH